MQRAWVVGMCVTRSNTRNVRPLYSLTGKWPEKFTRNDREKMEKYWQDKLLCRQGRQSAGEKAYILPMFPYSSGRLHMGHMRVYTVSDSIAHYYRLNGCHVLHPIGWDSFGLPAENAAIERGLLPDDWTRDNITSMRGQLRDLSLTFDWDREVTTCHPDYYKWTQYLFLKMFEEGLAYQKESAVNWDPVDETVLANEQVNDEGRSWRSGAKVERKYLKQWFLKLTKYSQQLHAGLRGLEGWPNTVRSMQQYWIGECNGCYIDCQLLINGVHSPSTISIFTSTPQLIHGASHVLVAPDNWILHSQTLGLPSPLTELCGERRVSEVEVINPLNGAVLPVFVSTVCEYPGRTDSHLAVPCYSEADKLSADKHSLKFSNVLSDTEPRTLLNSAQYTGLTLEAAFDAVTQSLQRRNIGGYITSSKCFDWLISRQRYWGTPIPVIHCPRCDVVPVPYDQLPVLLPKLDKFTKKGGSELEKATEWRVTPCPQCGGEGSRETDTMDTFVDSAWYFLRYTDPCNPVTPFSRGAADQLMPVDVYIGGIEHALLHLYYARFLTHFTQQHDMLSTVTEPFNKLLVVGVVEGRSYKSLTTGGYVVPDNIDNTGEYPVVTATGERVDVEWEKMSKSKNNGVDPRDVIAEHGIDSVRLYILGRVPPDKNIRWDTGELVGVFRFKNKAWSLVTRFLRERAQTSAPQQLTPELMNKETELGKLLNRTISDVENEFEVKHDLCVVVYRLFTMLDRLRKSDRELLRHSRVYEHTLCAFIIMLTPMAPHTAAELWRGVSSAGDMLTDLDFSKDVFDQSWPTPLSVEENRSEIPFLVKINYKIIGWVLVPVGVTGERGEVGVTGERGEVGVTGERGEVGVIGERGEVVDYLLTTDIVRTAVSGRLVQGFKTNHKHREMINFIIKK